MPSTPGGNTPLHVACALGHMAMVSFLVRHGADRDLCDACGKRPYELTSMADTKKMLASYATKD